MEHVDPALVALLALGEPTEASVVAHIRDCPSCAADLAGLRRAVQVGRAVELDDRPVAPRPEVWERITAEIGSAPMPQERPAPPDIAGSPSRPDGPVAALPLESRARRRGLLAVAAGIVGLLVGLAVAGLPEVLDGDGEAPPAAAPTSGPTPAVLARATLAALPDRSLNGSATVLQTGAGRILQVQLAGEVPADGYREIWLLTANAQGLVSLGVLPGTEAAIPLPAGLDLAAFPVVDVSQEQFDGNPAHSADSLSRGTLS